MSQAFRRATGSNPCDTYATTASVRGYFLRRRLAASRRAARSESETTSSGAVPGDEPAPEEPHPATVIRKVATATPARKVFTLSVYLASAPASDTSRDLRALGGLSLL